MAYPRNELKYYIPKPFAVLLQKRLSHVLSYDSHALNDGSYWITSLYFDDLFSSALNDKLDGIEKRTKYRIRYYNKNQDLIRLEKKRKDGQKSFKDATRLTLEQAQQLASGNAVPSDDRLIAEMNHLLCHRALRPSIFVEYRRRAFLYPAGNVRITLDDELTVSGFSQSLFKPCPPKIPVLLQGSVILEVKYDSIFPRHLSALLSDIPKINCAISKYANCREAFR